MGFFKSFGKRAFGLLTAVSVSLGAFAVSAAAETKSLPDNEAIVFADHLGAGWNLGNAFDASNCSWLTDELDYETAWCRARTTKELIAEIASIGFSTIRIPVSWHNHVDSDFNISKQWADRVQEVVDWSLDAGLKVILNVHHDVEKGFYYPSSDEYKTSEKYITSVWKQIAERYKDYDERLVFEIINEPRAKGTNYEWWFNFNAPSAEIKDSLDCINRLNQAALDTIRASGEKNKNRYVIVCGHATSTNGITMKEFVLPEDSTENRLILAIHVYTKSDSEYTGLFKRVYSQYISKGIPVVMDEYNLNENANSYDAKTAEWLGAWVKCAREYGISTVIWDNNAKEYKLIDRASVKWEHKDVAESIVKNGAPTLSEKSDQAESGEKNPAQKKNEKPVLTAKANGTKASLSWTAAEGAEKYRVCQYKNGKLVKIKDTKKLKMTVSGLKSGKTYRYAVRAYVDGKWTAVKKSEIKSVKIK